LINLIINFVIDENIDVTPFHVDNLKKYR